MVHMAADCYSKTVKEKDHEKKRHPEKKKNGQRSCWPNQQRAHAAVGNEDEERALFRLLTIQTMNLGLYSLRMSLNPLQSNGPEEPLAI